MARERILVFCVGGDGGRVWGAEREREAGRESEWIDGGRKT